MMRFGYLFLTALLSITAVAQLNITELVSEIPHCTEQCALASIEAAQCQLTSLADCMCTNTTLQNQLGICVLNTCNLTEQTLSSTIFQEQLCEGFPVPSRSGEIKNITIIMTVIAFLAIALRCVHRCLVSGFGWDDYAIFLSAAFMIAMSTLTILYAEYGMGKHFWDIPPLRVILLHKLYYIAQILYTALHVLPKASILCLYLRIFPDKRFRIITKICLALMGCHFVGFLSAVSLQCIPVSALWNVAIKGQCVSAQALGFAGAGASIVEDIVLIILPVSQLKGLNLNFKKKIALIFMFAFGSFACLTSIIRLKFMIGYGHDPDASWDEVDVIIWSVVEEYTAVTCACLITLRGLLVRMFPRLFKVKKTSELQSYSTHPSRRARVPSRLAGRLGYMSRNGEILSGSDTESELKRDSRKNMVGLATFTTVDIEEIGLGV